MQRWCNKNPLGNEARGNVKFSTETVNYYELRGKDNKCLSK